MFNPLGSVKAHHIDVGTEKVVHLNCEHGQSQCPKT